MKLNKRENHGLYFFFYGVGASIALAKRNGKEKFAQYSSYQLFVGSSYDLKFYFPYLFSLITFLFNK
jgi:hypothetical protein